MTPPVVLTIAGSDPCGGAGIQADLKTFAALGAYGASVVTAITAQNSRGVTAVAAVPPDLVAAQLDAVLADLPVAAVKVGMLTSVRTAALIAGRTLPNLVLDPVLSASAGGELGNRAAIELLLPHATVVTPNRAEAAVLKGAAPYIVVTGSGEDDVLYHDGVPQILATQRIDTRNTHGTGCTFSSAVAARLAHGDPVPDAVRRAKEYVTGALRGAAGWTLGSGAGPLDHFGFGELR